MFKIQEARYGTDWQDVTEEYYLSDLVVGAGFSENLSDWIKVAESMETFDRYNYRIINETETTIYWHQCMPFDPRRVNIIGNHDWMEEIRQGYGIDPEVWAKACRVYLDNYYKEQNEKAQNT